MSADSICQIIRYVRQNAWKKPELWPFSTGPSPGPTPSLKYFNLEGETQTAGQKCRLIMNKSASDDPQIDLVYAKAKKITAGMYITENEKASKNTIEINPDLVEIFVYAPSAGKRSAYFQARNPTFELPIDYPTLIEESVVEVQCPLYVPTPTTSDSYEKYRAVNIDYLNNHMPSVDNYVERIGSKFMEAALRLKPWGSEPTITIDNTDENKSMEISASLIRIAWGSTYKSTYSYSNLLFQTESNYGSKLSSNELTLYNHIAHGYLTLTSPQPSTPLIELNQDKYVTTDNKIPLLSHSVTGRWSPTTSAAVTTISSSVSEESDGQIRGFKNIELTTSFSRLSNLSQTIKISTGGAVLPTQIVPIDFQDIITFSETNAHGTPRTGFVVWSSSYNSAEDIIQDDFDIEDPHPVRKVLRCHYIDNRKVISECVQFDDNTEMVLWERFLDDDKNIRAIEDDSMEKYVESKSYQTIIDNRKARKAGF